MKTRIVILFILATLSVSSFGHAAATEWQVNANGRVRLISGEDRVSKQGTINLGFQFKTAPGWYVYWKVAGDAGFPPNVKWNGSEGIVDPQMLWPAPTKFILPGDIVEYGYEGEVVYPVQAQLNPTGDTVHIAATISYLTCYTACVPYKYAFTLDIPVGAAEPAPEEKTLIDHYLAMVPADHPRDEQIEHKAPVIVKHPLPISDAPAEHNPLSNITLFGLAFLGGLLLNVMPCVLPVLAIKLLGLVKQAGYARGEVVKNSLLSAAGIVTSFIALGTIAALAKVGGRAVGWGIQFQNPAFVLFLAVVVFLFALNMWGVFEIQMPHIFGRLATTANDQDTALSHFTSGLFATLLATPCSAPFLGTAMGFALTQPSPTIFAAFFIAGCGMATPYFILALFPASLGWLPKPGLWMVRLKAFFGILLAGTALWLVWVFMQQVRPTPQTPFDESAIQTLLAQGTPVLVDVTADWCVTCKYNEQFVLKSLAVKEALQKRGVVIMRADWTNRNEAIRQYLAKFGRSGIPFYAFYEPGKVPVTLSEFLTKAQALDVLNK